MQVDEWEVRVQVEEPMLMVFWTDGDEGCGD